MASLLGTLHFWSLKEDNFATAADLGCYTYHGKIPTTNYPYYEDLKKFCEARGVTWRPSKRPEKLRANLKELEELLGTLRCVYCAWRHRNCLQIMFDNGTLVTVWMKAAIGDVQKIRIDKHLVGKLVSPHIVEVLFRDSMILVSYNESKLTSIHLTKKSGDSDDKVQKLSSMDPKIVTTNLIGPTGRRLERRMSVNVQNNQMLVWWSSSNDGLWPWTPMSTDRERANFHVYGIAGTDIKLLCYARTKADPKWAAYSKHHVHQIFTIEQQISNKEITVDMGVYDVSKNKVQRLPSTTIRLASPLACHDMNLAENRVLLGCEDGSLVVYDVIKRSTHLTRAGFVPAVIGWHPSGSIVVVGSKNGQIQCYDMALRCLNLEILSEEQNPTRLLDLAIYLRFQPSLQRMVWNPEEDAPVDGAGFLDTTHTALLLIDKGPLTVLMLNAGVHNDAVLSPYELIAEYVKCSQTDEAVHLLSSLDWNMDADMCYKCLVLIVTRLLKQPLDEDREIQMEVALGTYYSPSCPLSGSVTQGFDLKVHFLARRFFHQLLRYERFEKAFLLAADIGDRDLFMDIHYVAADKKEHILAQVALDRARQLESRPDSSSSSQRSDDTRGSTFHDSSSSSTSCSSCDSEEEPFDDAPGAGFQEFASVLPPSGRGAPPPKEQPPPLPPASLPPEPLLRAGLPQEPPGVHLPRARTVDDGSGPSRWTMEHRGPVSRQGQSYQWHETQTPAIEPSSSSRPSAVGGGTGAAARGSGVGGGGGASRSLQTIPDDVEGSSEEDEDGHGTVHVVHFGVV